MLIISRNSMASRGRAWQDADPRRLQLRLLVLGGLRIQLHLQLCLSACSSSPDPDIDPADWKASMCACVFERHV